MVKEKVLETIKKYNLISKNDKIVVAVSGGPDSMCLLHILLTLRKEYNLELNVAHVNHMIRENAILDEEYVKDFCQKNNLNFFVKKVDVHELSQKDRIGTEEAGRKARYEFFNEVKEMTSSNKIAIAHNKNDKVETIFLNSASASASLPTVIVVLDSLIDPILLAHTPFKALILPPIITPLPSKITTLSLHATSAFTS